MCSLISLHQYINFSISVPICHDLTTKYYSVNAFDTNASSSPMYAKGHTRDRSTTDFQSNTAATTQKRFVTTSHRPAQESQPHLKVITQNIMAQKKFSEMKLYYAHLLPSPYKAYYRMNR